MKKVIVIYSILLLLIVSSFASAQVTLDNNVFLHCDDNEIYQAPGHPFDTVTAAGDWIQFNNTAFVCDFPDNLKDAERKGLTKNNGGD